MSARGRGRAVPRAARLPDATLFPPGTLPVFLGVFATLFGAGGLICRSSFRFGPVLSVKAAALSALVATLLVAIGLWRYFLAGTAASEVRGGSPLGSLGHVSISIPEGGVGAVAIVAEGKRVTLPARGHGGDSIALRSQVMIVDFVGNTAVVEHVDRWS